MLRERRARTRAMGLERRVGPGSGVEIAELERTGKPSRTITIDSPFDGVVLKTSM